LCVRCKRGTEVCVSRDLSFCLALVTHEQMTDAWIDAMHGFTFIDTSCLEVVPGAQGAVVVEHTRVVAARNETALLAEALVRGALQLGEAPLVRVDDLLATRELELAAAESLVHVLLVVIAAAHRDEDLANVDTGDQASGLAEGTAHTGLETAFVWGAGRAHTSVHGDGDQLSRQARRRARQTRTDQLQRTKASC